MTLIPINTLAVAQQSKAIQEMAVSSYLEQARDWLAGAVERTGPEEIAGAKAQIATAAEATKQLGLSKEIQLDAVEMVRRAEYALGKAIRKGQGEGTVLRRGQQVLHLGEDHARPTDFGSPSEVYGNGKSGGLIEFADTPREHFDAAIAEAKDEGNLSRANVARKAREKSGVPTPSEGTERAHQEAEVINAFASIVRRSLTPKNISTLSPKAKARLVAILRDAINSLEGTNS